jgi:gamma-glutamylcyclotransferase (GGCT)/AIG2-like uncharacterized protein YtfP
MAKTKYYFAYGSNMNMKYLKTWIVQHGARPDGIRSAQKGILKGYRIVANQYSKVWKCGNVNLVPDPNGTVEGVLMEIDNSIESLLDKKESMLNGYERKNVKVTDEEGREFDKVFLYLSPKASLEASHPVSQQYLQTILTGATEFGISDEYVGRLKALPVSQQQ